MSTHDVLVRFRATVEGFTAPVDKARARVEALHDATLKASSTKGWKSLSTTAVVAGAAITGALGYATKAAMDWESAWAGVLKTVNASPAQFAELEGQLKDLVRTLPASAQEIAAVAENAGQLGIRAADIARFTKTMIGLGVSTNLTSDEAATAIAQIANIMGTTGADIDRFGATLVALGNNGASTERDILQMANRIAAAGKLVGLNEQDILAYASALSSVGIEAEAGGTAISQSFQKIADYVDYGGEKLKTVAKVAGTSSDAFRKAWKNDAGSAMAAFIKGLDGVQKQGGSASRVLDDLSLGGIRQKNALLSAATAGDLLTSSLALSKAAWSANSALAAETARRYATTASQGKIAINTMNQAAADLGEAFLPVVADAAKGLSAVSKGFITLPAGVKSAIAGVSGFTGVGLLAVGGTMKLVTGLQTLRTSADELGKTFPRLAAKIKGLSFTKVAIGAGIAAAAIAGLSWALGDQGRRANEAMLSTEGVASGLEHLGKAGVGLAPLQLQVDKLNEALGHTLPLVSIPSVSHLGDAFSRLSDTVHGDGYNQFHDWLMASTDGMLGMRTDIGLLKQSVSDLDAGLAGLANGGKIQDAQRAFSALVQDAMDANGWSQAWAQNRVAEQLPAYTSQLEQTAAALGVTQLHTTELSDWMGGIMPMRVRAAAAAHPELVSALDDTQKALIGEADMANKAAEALQKQAEATRDAAKAQIQGSGSLVDWHRTMADTEAALKKVTVSVNKSHTAMNLNTKAGRDNQDVLDGLALKTLNTAKAMEDAGESTKTVANMTTEARSEFIHAATTMGLTSAAANQLADDYGLIPDKVATLVELPGGKTAKVEAEDIRERLNDIPVSKRPEVIAIYKRDGVEAANRELDKLGAKVVEPTVKVKWSGTTATLKIGTNGRMRIGMASGGWVDGPGSWTSDSVPVNLSRDEFVVRASRATTIERRHPGFLRYLNSDDPLERLGLAGGGSPRIGGFAPAAAYSTSSSNYSSADRTIVLGNVTWKPETPQEARTFDEFMEMAGRKAAAGLGGRRGRR